MVSSLLTSGRHMHTWLEISRSALIHNYRVFKDMVAPLPLMPVVKSNAYGHGLNEVIDILMEENPPWLAVNYLEEAETIRLKGFKGNILVVGPVFMDQFAHASSLNITLFLSHMENLKAWVNSDDKPAVHIKIDTGMSRQGFYLSELSEVITLLSPYRDLVGGIATHFANVEDVLEHAYATQQMSEFDLAIKMFLDAGFSNLITHAASSASTLLLQKSRYSLCRIGISLYGFWPSQPTRLSYLQMNNRVEELRPALKWKTRIAQVKTVKAGKFVGYGCTFRVMRDSVIAVLPLGYYEGYPRIAGNSHSYVLLRGQRCPIVGRICMNMMMIDVSHLDAVKLGEMVTLVGEDHGESISCADVASWSETIHYELAARIHPSIQRRIVP